MISPERYLAAVAMLVVSGLSLGFGARALRQRFLPSWAGAPALLAAIVIAVVMLVAVAQFAGVAGLLEAPVIVLGVVVAGASAVLVGRRDRILAAASHVTAAPAAAGRGDRAHPWRLASPVLALVALAVGFLLAQWVARTLAGLDRGMLNQDSVWYHLPLAGRFVQDGSITSLFFASSDPLSSFPRDAGQLNSPSIGPTFYPATSSLLHAVGMLLVGADTLSPVVNLGWCLLALLAAWCIGLPSGRAPVTLAAAALALGVPALAGTQPGDATNDVVGVALLLCAAALLINGRGERGASGLAALAGGLAAGVKLTFLGPVLALAVGAVATADRDLRRWVAASWLAAGIGLGAVWFIRNLAHTGSPLPLVKLGIGKLALPTAGSPTLGHAGESLADYATDAEVWSTAFVPALPDGFGVAWPLVLALMGGGITLGVTMAKSKLVRMLALVAAVSTIAYVFTPQSAGGAGPGNPGLFLFNMRFLAPALALGLVVLPLCRPFRSEPARSLLAATLALVLLATLAGSSAWPDSARLVLAGAALTAGVAVSPFLLRVSRPLWAGRAAVAGVSLLVLALPAGWVAQRHYLANRYVGPDASRRATHAWAADLHDARIAIVGRVALEQYPLYGKDLSNRVEYLAREGAHGAFRPYTSCGAWRRALADGGYDFVVVSRFDFKRSPIEERWTRPGSREVLRDGDLSIFRLVGRPSPADCARASASIRGASPASVTSRSWTTLAERLSSTSTKR